MLDLYQRLPSQIVLNYGRSYNLKYIKYMRVSDKSSIIENGLPLFIFLLPYILPPSFESILPRIYHDLLACMQIGSFLFVTLLWCFKWRTDIMCLTLIVYETIFILSTLVNSGTIYSAFEMAIQEFAVFFIIALSVRTKKVYHLCKICRYYFLILLIANLITILIYPDGMYYTVQSLNWLLGFDNIHVLYYFSSLAISIIVDYFENHLRHFSNTTYLILIISILTSVIRYTVTSLVALVIISVLFIIRHRIEKYPNLHPAKLSMWVMCAGFIVLVLVLGFKIDISMLFESNLNKIGAYLARARIWGNYFDQFTVSPLIGHGKMSHEVLHQFSSHDHPHNQILYELYSGGIIKLICFIQIIRLTNIKLYQCNNALSWALGCLIVGLALRWLFESMNFYIQLIPIILAYYCPEIVHESITNSIVTT